MVSISANNLSVKYFVRSPMDFNLKHYLLEKYSKTSFQPRVLTALQEVSFQLNEFDRLGVIGDNGAGKSTLLGVISGVITPDSGELSVEGEVLSLLNDPLSNLVPEASGLENIVQMLILYDFPELVHSDLIDEIIDFSGLKERIFDPVYTYSSGMKIRLKMSIILSLKPEILIMDEAFGFADEKFYAKAKTEVENFINGSKIVILTSHQPNYLNNFCNKGLILDKGRLVFFGDIEEALEIRKESLFEEK
jgi:ABC-2 type transport system ATP-binding protein